MFSLFEGRLFGLVVLDPLRHKIADLVIEIDTLCRSQCITRFLGMSLLVESFSAKLPRKVSASLPQPPREEKTNGVKEPCSTSITRRLYARFFSFSFVMKTAWRSRLTWLRANGWNTLTSKNALWPRCQNPLAATSRRASSCLFPPFSSPPFKCSMLGSISTSLQISLSSVAKVLRKSSCLEWMNPPFMHDRAWSTEKDLPHSHNVGRYFGCHRYLIARASWNSRLLREKLSWVEGTADNQLDEPFSWAMSFARLSSSDMDWRMWSSFLFCITSFCPTISFFFFMYTALSSLYKRSWLVMFSMSCWQIIWESWCCSVANSFKIGIDIPPLLKGRERRCLSSSEQMCPPVIAGMKKLSSVASKIPRCSWRLGRTLMWYVNLWRKPEQNPLKAAWGSILATSQRFFNWELHSPARVLA